MTWPENHIYLLGFMGCGKSTLGRLLANKAGRQFVDTDAVIEFRAGMSINTIFERHGEAHFRDLEMQVLRELAETWDAAHVIALGGGTPTRDEIWPFLKSSGVTIYLKRPAERLYEHLKHATDRPVLRRAPDGDVQAYIADLLSKREPSYERADIVFECGDTWDKEVSLEAIMKSIEEFSNRNKK